MTPDLLKKIIDEIFAAIDAATVGKPLVHIIVGIVHALALQLIPLIITKLPPVNVP